MNSIYSISPKDDFSVVFAQNLWSLLSYDQKALSESLIFVPNRRSVDTFSRAILSHCGHDATLLPEFFVLGEIWEGELSCLGSCDLHQPVGSFHRHVLLARLIMKGQWRSSHVHMRADQALKMAGDLAQLLDEIHIYMGSCSQDDFEKLVPLELANHWSKSLDFLKIVTAFWPEILKEFQVSDRIVYRNDSVDRFMNDLEKRAQDRHVIVAGCVGADPMERKVMKRVCDLRDGRIVFPGLFSADNPHAWSGIEQDPCHPEHLMFLTLKDLGCHPDQMIPWTGLNQSDEQSHQTFHEALFQWSCPRDDTHQWHEKIEMGPQALDHISLIQCPNDRQEALLVALLMRSYLDEPHIKVHMVTSDRGLAQRVCHELKRFGLHVDDSGGVSGIRTFTGRFFALILQALMEDFQVIDVLALLKHPLCVMGRSCAHWQRAIDVFDCHIARGNSCSSGLDGLGKAIERWRNQNTQVKDADKLTCLFNDFKRCFEPLSFALSSSHHCGKKMLRALIDVAHLLAQTCEEKECEHLWSGPDGQALAQEFARCLDAIEDMGPISLFEWGAVLKGLIKDMVVRWPDTGHERLKILGPIEAQLHHGDVVILSGLYEGTWPRLKGQGSWMSESMRQTLGLPSCDVSIGRSAHDFFHLLGSKRVVMTHSSHVQGQGVQPSRWLMRLQALLPPHRHGDRVFEKYWRGYIETMEREKGIGDQSVCLQDFSKALMENQRPCVDVPLHARPREISATQVETLMHDPYVYYAREILKLRPIVGFEKETLMRDYGIFFHNLLDKIVREDWDEERAFQQAQSLWPFEDARPSDGMFLWQRCHHDLTWFMKTYEKIRGLGVKSWTEISGELILPSSAVTLTARLDRVDIFDDQTWQVVDYKTGSVPSWPQVLGGWKGQIILQALIFERSGWGQLMGDGAAGAGGDKPVSFWSFSSDGPKIKFLKIKNWDELMEQTHGGVDQLMHCFMQEKTPYLAQPCDSRPLNYDDYHHLSRYQSWKGR